MQLAEKSSRNTHPCVLDAGEMQIFPGVDLLEAEDSHSTGWQINSWEVRDATSTPCEQAQLQPGSVQQVPMALQGDLLLQRLLQLWRSVLEDFFFLRQRKEKTKRKKTQPILFFWAVHGAEHFPEPQP